MSDDFSDLGLGGHGGARAGSGSGRKPAGYVKPQEALDYDRARARNEQAKAEKNELELKVMTGQYIARAAVQQAAATTVAGLAQTLRSIPDNLERKGVSAEVCAKVEFAIDEAMKEAAQQMELMANPPTA